MTAIATEPASRASAMPKSRSPRRMFLRCNSGSISAPPGNTSPLLPRDHAAPESTLALAEAASLGRARVRPLAWCSRRRIRAGLPEWALAHQHRVDRHGHEEQREIGQRVAEEPAGPRGRRLPLEREREADERRAEDGRA